MRTRNNTTLFLTLMMLCATAAPSGAQEADVTQMPIANATTVVIAEVQPDKITFPDWFADKDSEFFGVADSLKSSLEQLKAASPNDPVFAAIDVPYASTHAAMRVLFRNQEDGDYQNNSLGSKGRFEYSLDGFQARTRFEQAKQSTQDLPVKVLIAPPQYIYDTFDQLMPNLPEVLGGGPTSVVTRGLQWASVGVDPSNLTIRATINSNTNEDAKALSEALPTLLRGGLKLLSEPQRSDIQPMADVLLRTMKVEVDGSYVRINFPDLGDNQATRQLITELANQMTGPVSRNTKSNKFRSIILGILNYESANQVMPPAAKRRGEDGKPGLSWRVHILPYFGAEGQELWQRFHLDEPWDSPHNKTLLAELPDIYDPKGRYSKTPMLKPGYTTYVAPVGEGTVFGQTKPTRFSQVRDGSSKTMVLLEVTPEKAVPWTAPQDYEFDTIDPASDIAWGRDDITLGGFCDGHIEQLKREIPKETWLRLFQMDDGKPIRLP